MTKQDYIYIQSNRDVVVTPGLQYKDLTDTKLNVPDKLKISPVWSKMRVLIRKGRHSYPAYVAEWTTVKALLKDGVLTIGEKTSEGSEEAKRTKAKVDREMKSLEELATTKEE